MFVLYVSDAASDAAAAAADAASVAFLYWLLLLCVVSKFRGKRRFLGRHNKGVCMVLGGARARASPFPLFLREAEKVPDAWR